MRLVIVRHAEAASGAPDELRPLTANGREQARDLGRRLRDDVGRPDAVLSSPLLRARETAEEIARALGTMPAADERLAPGATAEAVRDAASDHDTDKIVAIGHQPDCGRIAAALTGGPEPEFPTAGVVVIDLPGAGG